MVLNYFHMTSNDGWQIIYSHDGYKRPVFDWEDSHILNFSTAGSGSGTLSSPTTMTIVNAGNTIDYTATPGGSSSFSERQQNDGSTYSTEKTITLSDIKADSPLTAVFEPRSGTYTAVFTITNGAGAIVTLDGQDYKLDSNGELSISNLENGTYSYKITRSGSTSLSGTVTISEADVAVTGTIESVIFIYTFDVQRISTGIVVENATVTCTYNSSATSKTTDVNGQVDFYNYYGSFQYKVEANGYKTVSGTFYNYSTNKKHNKTINYTTDRIKKQKKGATPLRIRPIVVSLFLVKIKLQHGQRYSKEFSRSADIQTSYENSSKGKI
jgi:hypothetical protein